MRQPLSSQVQYGQMDGSLAERMRRQRLAQQQAMMSHGQQPNQRYGGDGLTAKQQADRDFDAEQAQILSEMQGLGRTLSPFERALPNTGSPAEVGQIMRNTITAPFAGAAVSGGASIAQHLATLGGKGLGGKIARGVGSVLNPQMSPGQVNTFGGRMAKTANQSAINPDDAQILSRNGERAAEPFPKASATVDGLTVGSDIPNTSSIGASLSDYDELPGIRAVNVADFDSLATKDMFYAVDDVKRVDALAEEIRQSGRIDPLIVVKDDEGLYILEGGHRAAALNKLGKKQFPAMVLDESTARAAPAIGAGGLLMNEPEQPQPAPFEALFGVPRKKRDPKAGG